MEGRKVREITRDSVGRNTVARGSAASLFTDKPTLCSVASSVNAVYSSVDCENACALLRRVFEGEAVWTMVDFSVLL